MPEPMTEFEVSEAFAGTFSSGWWRVPPQLASGQLASGVGRVAAAGAMPSVVLRELIILLVAKICNSTQFSTRQRPCQPRFPENCFLISKVHLLTVPSCRRDRKSPHAPQFSSSRRVCCLADLLRVGHVTGVDLVRERAVAARRFGHAVCGWFREGSIPACMGELPREFSNATQHRVSFVRDPRSIASGVGALDAGAEGA